MELRRWAEQHPRAAGHHGTGRWWEQHTLDPLPGSEPVQLWGRGLVPARGGEPGQYSGGSPPGPLPNRPVQLRAAVCAQPKAGGNSDTPVLAGPPSAMSNDPPPPYPGGPSAPLIEEKHGPPTAPGTGGVVGAAGARGDIAERAGAPRVWERPGRGLSTQLCPSSVTTSPSGLAGGPRAGTGAEALPTHSLALLAAAGNTG